MTPSQYVKMRQVNETSINSVYTNMSIEAKKEGPETEVNRIALNSFIKKNNINNN